MKNVVLATLGLMLGIVPNIVYTAAPPNYTALDWVGKPGITSYIRVPERIGYIDYLTIIDLSKNDVKLLSTPFFSRTLEGPAVGPFQDALAKNWLFSRSIVESLKSAHPEAKFIWNAPFFNVTMTSTVLSLGLKSTDAAGSYITSGGRPESDMLEARRMLIIDNKSGKARIADFDAVIFASQGDQAVEGFHPLGSPSNRAVQAARVYLGVHPNGNELYVYCSKSASKDEASKALINAGIPIEQQIQVDGGGSATCAYNLPGHYFVEPGRALPHIMGAIAKVQIDKGTVTIEGLNVRTGAGTNSPSVRKLSKGEEVTLYELKDSWYRISNTEWIHSGFVKKAVSFPYAALVSINELNVRSGIGTGFAVTRKVNANDPITVYEEKNGWVRISENEWVSGKYVK